MAVEWQRYGNEWDAFAGGIVWATVFQPSTGAFIAFVKGNPRSRHPLAATDIDAAKAEALGIARRMLVEAVEALGEVRT